MGKDLGKSHGGEADSGGLERITDGRGSHAGLNALAGPYAVHRPIERGDRPDPRSLRARSEIRLGEVDPVRLVHLEGSEKDGRVENDDGRESNRSSQALGDLLALELVERLEDVDDLGEDDVCEDEPFGARSPSTRRRLAMALPRAGAGIPPCYHGTKRSRKAHRRRGPALVALAVA